MVANVNKHHITSKTCSALFLIATFLRDLGTEEKRGFYFLTLCELPDTPGTHIYV